MIWETITVSFEFKYSPPFRYWELAVARRADLWTGPDPLMHNLPQVGFYKSKFAGVWEGVAIFMAQDKVLMATRGKDRITCPAEDAWTYCAAHPISYEAYAEWWDTGKFPGEIADAPGAETPGIGHNSGDERGLIIEKALRAKGEALLALGTVEGNPAAMPAAKADELANWDAALLKYAQKLEAMRKAEKSAWTDAARRVDGQYHPTIEELRDVRGMLKDKLTPFALLHPGAKLGGQFGNRASLRRKVVAHIDDPVAAAKFFAEREEPHLMAALELLAKTAARMKDRETIPGISFSEEASVQ